MSGEEILYSSGVDFATGGYALPPTPARELAALARGGRRDGEPARDAATWLAGQRSGNRRLAEGDARDLAQAGWGVVFAQGDEPAPAIREALGELLAHRRAQAGALRAH